MTEEDAKDRFALFETMPELCAFVYQDRGPETLLKGLTFGDSSPHGDREFYEQSALELEAMGLKKVASVVWEAAATRVSKFDRWEPRNDRRQDGVKKANKTRLFRAYQTQDETRRNLQNARARDEQ